jgi:hypothetical protein
MHIHLPKPLHGWREFAGEVGIIVIGVLIALGAEQVLEDFHWRHETEAAREALNSDAASSLHSADSRQRQQPCIDRRLREIAGIFEDHAHGRPLNIHGSIGRPVYYGGSQNAWQVEVADQSLSHMPLAEKLRFSTAFNSYANLRETLLREQDAWLRLQILDNPDVLQEGDWPVLHQAFAEASSLNRRLEVITSDTLTNDTLGQEPLRGKPPLGIQRALKAICSPVRS